MINKNVISILIAFLLATFDLFNMSMIKNITIGQSPKIFLWLITLLYALQPWIFFNGLAFTSMTVLNLSWDLISSILVTISGVLYFRESLTEYRFVGVLFALVSITLFALDVSSEVS